MTEETIEFPQPKIEQRKIEVLLERYKESLGNYKVVPVGDVGFLLQSEKQKPMAGNDWCLFDYDDSLAATSESKNTRLNQYKMLLANTGLNLPDILVSKVIEDTDQFARWEDLSGRGDDYHLNAHMTVLDWATKELIKYHEKNQEDKVDWDSAVGSIEQKLSAIKSQLQDKVVHRQDDPFYFQEGTKRFINRSVIPWSKEIENVFMQSNIHPDIYTEAVDAAKTIGQPKDSIHRINLGIFTYGDPDFQLYKVLELIKKNPDLPLSQIWLTKIPKGEFIKELIKTKAVQKTELDYPPSNLEEDEMGSLSYGSGYPLGTTPHVILMFDDNPKELESLLSTNEFLQQENSGATFVAVRSKRDKTKHGNTNWQVATKYGEVDFTSKPFSGSDIAKIIQINRYLTLKKKLGDDNPSVKALGQSLRNIDFEKGVNTDSLK